MLLLIDNYDSFTFNLVQLIGTVAPGVEVRVVRNDAVTVEEARALGASHLLISPGPCTPTESGVSNELIAALGASTPTLGVCLGHQCLGFSHGGVVERAGKLMHGKTDQMHHDGTGVFAGIPSPFTATRYHSLIVREASLSDEWLINARTAEGEIMGLRHRHKPLHGVQFHPESFLTEHGDTLIRNFLAMKAGDSSKLVG
jgi:anthranilate synthase/aminodeoxychorismate synthase-like glutamine amidotransferase